MPCKFFKQGACQAGKSCPFSHVLGDTNEQAPCKYFQKGNCKFGAKCALAHILPDGRRVATAQNSQQNGHRKRRDAPLDMGYAQAHNYPMAQPSSQSTAVLTHGLYPAPGASSKSSVSNHSPVTSSITTTAIGVERSMSSSNSRLSGSAFMSIMGSSADAHQHAGSNNGSAFSSTLVPSSPQSRSLYSIFGSPPYAGRGAPVSASVSAIQGDRIFSSPPTARSLSGSIWNDPPTSLHNRISTTSKSYLEGSAIADDEDDEDEDNGLAGFNDNDDDDYEGMVPSALTDLLTPRERQRRDSRHASSSNWGSPRPILKQNPGNSDYRVEPIGTPTHSSLGPSINSPANGALSSVQLGGPSPPSSWLQTVVNGPNAGTSIQASSASHTPVGHDDETQFIMDEVYRK